MLRRNDIATSAVIEQLEVALPPLMTQVPGLSLAIISNGDIVLSRGFGVKDVDTAGPVTSETVFQAASLSKPLFAYAVLHLVERGEIALDRPLTRYLSTPYVPDDPLLDQVTARMVLCHRTGWPNWRPEGQPLIRDRPPGEEFGYSGEGYQYLQQVIEQVTGQPLDVFMMHTVLAPLGMSHSSYAWAAPDDTAVATGHDYMGKLCTPLIGARPQAAASLHTTPTDYAHFLRAMLNPGRAPGHVSSQGIEEMLRPHVKLEHGIAWGLGWGLQSTKDGSAFWHSGDNPGFKSFTLTYPETRMGIVMMANSDAGVALWKPLIQIILGGDYPVLT